jgi:hypothetical protein
VARGAVVAAVGSTRRVREEEWEGEKTHLQFV